VSTPLVPGLVIIGEVKVCLCGENPRTVLASLSICPSIITSHEKHVMITRQDRLQGRRGSDGSVLRTPTGDHMLCVDMTIETRVRPESRWIVTGEILLVIYSP